MGSASDATAYDVYSVVGDRYTFLLTGAQSAGACFMFEGFIPPGNGSPPHVHYHEDEAFYVIEGEFEINVAGESIRVSTGGFLFSKRGIPHNFKNVGTTPGRILITVMPAGLEKFFAEVGTKLQSGNDAPIPPSPDDIARLIQAAPRYGMEILLPH